MPASYRQQQPANPHLAGTRPLDDIEAGFIQKHRIALARLYEACLQADDEELEDENEQGEALANAGKLEARATAKGDEGSGKPSFTS